MHKKVCQGSLSRNISILLFQKWYKKVPQNGENAYLVMKIPKSFQGPKAGPRPHAEKDSLRSHDAAAHHWQFRPVTIWAPPRSNPGSTPGQYVQICWKMLGPIESYITAKGYIISFVLASVAL